MCAFWSQNAFTFIQGPKNKTWRDKWEIKCCFFTKNCNMFKVNCENDSQTLIDLRDMSKLNQTISWEHHLTHVLTNAPSVRNWSRMLQMMRHESIYCIITNNITVMQYINVQNDINQCVNTFILIQLIWILPFGVVQDPITNCPDRVLIVSYCLISVDY